MKQLHSFDELRQIKDTKVYALGTIDGSHRGHQRVIHKAVEEAISVDGVSIIITFEHHPLTILHPERVPKRVIQEEIMDTVLEELKVDYILRLPMTEALLKMTADEKYMREAIKQAKKAYAIGEVPIGCVIVYQDKIIARGYNRRTIDKNTLAHAELQAIRKASKKMEDWRLEECTMYVTLEPCQMCSGAIVQSRMTRVVVGCMNPKAGCAGSILNLLQMPQFNHQVDLTTGVLEEECSQMMKTFFKELREKRKKNKQ